MRLSTMVAVLASMALAAPAWACQWWQKNCVPEVSSDGSLAAIAALAAVALIVWERRRSRS